MELEMIEPDFKSYKIVIRTKEEHDFLLGLFRGGTDIRKKNCSNYSLDLDWEFHTLLSKFNKGEKHE